MNLVDGIGRIFSLVQTFKDNQDDCSHCVQHLSSLEEILNKLKKEEDRSRWPQGMDKCLAKFEMSIVKAKALVAKHGNKGFIGRLIDAIFKGKIFDGVSKELTSHEQIFNHWNIQGLHEKMNLMMDRVMEIMELLRKGMLQCGNYPIY